MPTRTIPTEVYEEFLGARRVSGRPPLTVDEFIETLETWYQELQQAKCTLGYVAERLGITKIDLIALLDMMGW